MDNKILVTQTSMPSFDEYCEEIKSVWDSKWLTNNGPIHNKFKSQLADKMNCDNIELFVNGHQALVNVIKSMGLSGEIITTPFTFASTTNAIIEAGLVPVFCDVKLDDYTLDSSKIEDLITDKTCAIMPVHVFGYICDVDAINDIAKKHDLKVIYDAAHAFGVTCKGIDIAKYGDCSMFSFHATKVFNTIEGGCLVFADSSLSENIAMYRNFGLNPSTGDIDICGSNAKMNEFQAAMGVCNLRHLDSEIAKRKIVSDKYDELLSSVDGLSIMSAQSDVERNYAYYPIVIDEQVYPLDRELLIKLLNENDVFPRKYFYPALNDTKAYKGLYKGITPNSSQISERVICLPMYADLDLSSVEKICSIICSVKR